MNDEATSNQLMMITNTAIITHRTSSHLPLYSNLQILAVQSRMHICIFFRQYLLRGEVNQDMQHLQLTCPTPLQEGNSIHCLQLAMGQASANIFKIYARNTAIRDHSGTRALKLRHIWPILMLGCGFCSPLCTHLSEEKQTKSKKFNFFTTLKPHNLANLLSMNTRCRINYLVGTEPAQRSE